MNNDIALITDTHFGQKNQNKAIFQTQMYFFENQFFPYLLKYNIKKVYSLGDLVHSRDSISLWILQELKRRFFKWFDDNEVELNLITGNHDILYRNTLSHNFYEENIKEFKYCKHYTEDTVINIGKYTIGLIPWIVDTKTWVAPEKCDILLGHFEVAGIQMQKGIFSHHGQDSNVFKHFRKILSGHYHSKSQKDNLYYLGTQYQLSWSDFDEEKGFYVLRDNYQLDFIPNTTTPKFLKLYYNDESPKLSLKVAGLEKDKFKKVSLEQAVDLAKDNYFKVYIEKCKDQLSFDRLYESLAFVSKNDYKIEVINIDDILEDFDSASFEEFLELDNTTIQIVENYINNIVFDEGIDKQLLIDLSRQLYSEAYNESLLAED